MKYLFSIALTPTAGPAVPPYLNYPLTGFGIYFDDTRLDKE